MKSPPTQKRREGTRGKAGVDGKGNLVFCLPGSIPEARMSPGEVSIQFLVMTKFMIQNSDQGERMGDLSQHKDGREGERRRLQKLHSKFRLLNTLFISTKDGDR